MKLTRKLYAAATYRSPILPDVKRVQKLNKDGSLSVTYVDSNLPKVIEENGSVDLWSLQSMLQAGITPPNINTTPSSRLVNEEKVLEMDKQMADFIDSLPEPVDPVDPAITE